MNNKSKRTTVDEPATPLPNASLTRDAYELHLPNPVSYCLVMVIKGEEEEEFQDEHFMITGGMPFQEF